MTRQFSLGVLVFVVMASLFVVTRLQPPIFVPADETKIIRIEELRPKKNLTEIVGSGYLVKAFWLDGQIKPGDTILVQGKRVDVRDSTQKYFSKSYSNYLVSQKIYFIMNAGKVEKIKEGRNLYTWRSHVRESLSNLLDAMYGKEAPMVKALVYGDKSEMDKETGRLFAITGTSHVLALSGFHVGILGVLINAGFGGLSVKKRGLATILLLILYSFITGLRASILRAVGFFVIYYLSFVTHRRYNLIATATLMMALLLAVNPYYIYDMGFTLSFAGVYSIACFFPMLSRLAEKCGIRQNSLCSLVIVTLSAQILTLPLTVYYFGTLPLLAVFANLIVLPMISLLMPLGILSVGVGYAANKIPQLGLLKLGLAGTVRLIEKIILASLNFLGKLPYSHISDLSISNFKLIAIMSVLMAGYLYWEVRTIKENKYESQRDRKIITE